jgi:hypothetical protein
MDFVSTYEFHKCVDRYKGNYMVISIVNKNFFFFGREYWRNALVWMLASRLLCLALTIMEEFPQRCETPCRLSSCAWESLKFFPQLAIPGN